MLKISLIIIVAIISLCIIIYTFPLAFVEGRSMFPTYKDGGVLLATRLFNKNKLKIGQVYVYKRLNEDGQEFLVVKRLTKVIEVSYPYQHLCYFEGDNPTESYDSRQYGLINSENIVAKVMWKLKQ